MKKKTAEKKAEKAEKKAGGPRIITLAELGPQLPLGVLSPDGASQVRDIEVKNWNFRVERELSRAMENVEGNADAATYVTYVLAELCPRLGMVGHPDNLNKKSSKGITRSMIQNMYMGDVWYAYIWLRRQAIGNELDLSPRCLTCRKEFKFVADLDTVDVRIGDTLEDFFWEYELLRPFKVRGKEVVSVTMGPPAWAVCQKMVENPSDATVQFESIRASIYYLNEDRSRRATILDSDLDEMHKLDINGLASGSNNKHLGANMIVEISEEEHTCSAGHRNAYTLAIDWSYNSFFQSSSR